MTKGIFETGQRHHLAGRLAEAQQAYRQVLAIEPGNVDALHMLGVTELQLGRFSSAEELIGRAIRGYPNPRIFTETWDWSIPAPGRRSAAISEFRAAPKIQPNYPEARNNLGFELAKLGRIDEAISEYRAALGLRPDYLAAMRNLGMALQDRGDYAGAVAQLERVAAALPGVAEVQNDLGNALRNAGRLDDSAAALSQALALRPDFPEAHNNMGRVLHIRGNLPAAIAAYRRAIELSPDFAAAWSNLTVALGETFDFDGAAEAGRKAVEIAPEFPFGHINLANVLKETGEMETALFHWDRARKLDPRLVLAHGNRIFGMHFHPGFDSAAILAESREFNRIYAEPLRGKIQAHTNVPDPDRRLRIGYVSPDFYQQAVSHYVVSLLESHRHDEFEIFCYSSVERPDWITEREKRVADVWREVLYQPDERVAEIIREDRIDILVDLSMHMRGHRLLIFGESRRRCRRRGWRIQAERG